MASGDTEWRTAWPHRSKNDIELLDVREYTEGEDGSRFVCEAAPEDARQIVADRRRVRELEAALQEISACLAELHRYAGPTSIISRMVYDALAPAAPAGREGASGG